MSLNPEPAAPEERAEHDLPPKSFADAAKEALEPEPHVNGADANGNGNGTFEQNGKRLKKQIDDLKTTGIQTPPDEEQQSLEGIGQDATPRSPTLKGHRRVASRSSQGSLGRKYGEQLQNELVREHEDSRGNSLATVKPPRELEKDARVDRKRRDSQLKTGREAGAGWARSKYVFTHGLVANSLLMNSGFDLRR